IAHRLVDRHQPVAIRAEAPAAGGIAVVDVVEARRQSAQISDPVAVGIVERPDEHLIADAIVPPLVGSRAVLVFIPNGYRAARLVIPNDGFVRAGNQPAKREEKTHASHAISVLRATQSTTTCWRTLVRRP